MESLLALPLISLAIIAIVMTGIMMMICLHLSLMGVKDRKPFTVLGGIGWMSAQVFLLSIYLPRVQEQIAGLSTGGGI